MKKVSYRQYLDIFNHDFKLSFEQLKVNVCGECEALDTKLKNKFLNQTAKRAVETEKAVHERRSKNFYHVMWQDTVTNGDSVLSLVFDYMMNIPLPKIPVQEAFYLRQLTIFMFWVSNRKNTARM